MSSYGDTLRIVFLLKKIIGPRRWYEDIDYWSNKM